MMDPVWNRTDLILNCPTFLICVEHSDLLHSLTFTLVNF